MDKLNVLLENGKQKEVDCIFYLYNQKYYLIYTEKELDENDYVKMNVVQVGKEVNQTPNGPVDTGFLIGVDINSPEESQNVQNFITKIVEDKKNGTQSPEIKYMPITMLNNLKISSKKTFRLLRDLVEKYFGLVFEDDFSKTVNKSEFEETNENATFTSNENDVIVDYRSKFFEEEGKNQELQKQIDELKAKLESIKGIIE